MREIIIDERHQGPFGAANGGYVAGILGDTLGQVLRAWHPQTRRRSGSWSRRWRGPSPRPELPGRGTATRTVSSRGG